MNLGIYYVKITNDRIDVVTTLIEFIKNKILPKSRTLYGIRFTNKSVNHKVLLNKYLILQISEHDSSILFSIWKSNPENFYSSTYIYKHSLEFIITSLFQIVSNKCLTTTAFDNVLLFQFRDCLRTTLDLLTRNTHNYENQLQGKTTSRELRSNRNGIPIRYSGHKFTIAIGHLSNTKRTCKV